MLSSLFLKTYEPDLRWLEWCLKFLDKNWNEISTVTIMAPTNCMERIKDFKCDLNPELCPMEEWNTEGYHPNHSHVPGYIGQQYFKMVSDLYCPGEYITFIDSDAMLFKPTVLNDLCGSNGRPIIWYTSHDVLGSTTPWRRVVREIMMLDPELEFMRCHPFTYHRSTLKGCREHLERLHGCELRALMRTRLQWSEFNLEGFYAWIFEQELYDWRDTESRAEELQQWTRVKQFFSHGDWTPEMPAFLAGLLDDAPCETCNDDPEVCATVPGLGHCEKSQRVEVKEPDDAQLFICTWEKDLDWLEYALKSVDKYWRSACPTIIVATPECRERITKQMMPKNAHVLYEPKLDDHHRGQIYLKLHMDLLSSEPDLDVMICMDSDCMFTRESRYQDFCSDGKPIIHCESYDTLIPRSIPQDQNCFLHYRQLVNELLGINPPAEYMRQHPFVFFKDTIRKTRRLIEQRMGKPLLRVMEGWHSGYFSEFNLLGAYAAEFEPDRYFVSYVEAVEDRRVHQFHSWSQTPAGNPLVEAILLKPVETPKKTRKRRKCSTQSSKT